MYICTAKITSHGKGEGCWLRSKNCTQHNRAQHPTYSLVIKGNLCLTIACFALAGILTLLQRSSSKQEIIKKYQPRCSQIRVRFSLQEGSTLPMSAPVFARVVYKPYYVSGCHALQTKTGMLKLAPNSIHGKLM